MHNSTQFTQFTQLNGGESGDWVCLNLSADTPPPPPPVPDPDEITAFLEHLNEKPELAPSFVPMSLLYT